MRDTRTDTLMQWLSAGGAPARLAAVLGWLLFAAAGCASGGNEATGPDGGPEPLPTLEEILAMPSEAGDYVEAPRCLRVSTIRNIDVLDEQNLVFEAPRDKFYLVHFKFRCAGMRRNDPVALEPRNGQICKMDTLRGFQRYGSFQELGPACNITEFQPVTKEQIAMIKDSIRAARRRN